MIRSFTRRYRSMRMMWNWRKNPTNHPVKLFRGNDDDTGYLGMFISWLKEAFSPSRRNAAPHFDHYVTTTPSLQNAVDAVAGWHSSFARQYNVKAGTLAAYNDPRILWAIESFGSLEGRRVLELGPLDGGHTGMLDAAGAQVDAIEANQLAFLRCLITKEILQLKHTKFWLGDFTKALEDWDQSYDLIVACGVLYHQKDPLRLLELVAKRTNATYFWTHVVSEEAMPPSDPRRIVIDPVTETHDFHGVKVRAYRRTYASAEESVTFCGGMSDEHRWLNRHDLLEAIKAVGFNDIKLAHDESDHRYGPALSIFARK